MQRLTQTVHRKRAVQQAALLEAEMRDILIVLIQDRKARQDGVAMMPMVVHHVAAVSMVLPDLGGEKLVLWLRRPIGVAGGVLQMGALDFLQKNDIGIQFAQPFTQLMHHHPAVRWREAFVDIPGSDREHGVRKTALRQRVSCSKTEEASMSNKAFQDYYPDELSHCYGCGKNNPDGHQLKSYWDGDESVARYTPKPYHMAIPGFVYGGLIASLIDCHGTGTASAAAYRAAGREMGSLPSLRFVTGSLKVDYVAPTPQGVELELRGVAVEVKEKKVVVDITLSANGKLCAKGQVIAVRMPETMAPK